ncbi:MAG: hypothetical protein ACYDBR_04195 [Gaiellaceae bacterium]
MTGAAAAPPLVAAWIHDVAIWAEPNSSTRAISAGCSRRFAGFQGAPRSRCRAPAAASELYTGAENDRRPVSEATQATQLAAAVELAYCQPEVGGFFNFELRDESGLAGWQSGLMRPDWSTKPAFAAYLQAIAAARAGTIACGGR